jgi:hypothetical protein
MKHLLPFIVLLLPSCLFAETKHLTQAEFDVWVDSAVEFRLDNIYLRMAILELKIERAEKKIEKLESDSKNPFHINIQTETPLKGELK